MTTPYQSYESNFKIVGSSPAGSFWFSKHAIVTLETGSNKWIVLAPRIISSISASAPTTFFRNPADIRSLLTESYESGDHRFNNFIIGFLPKGFSGRLVLYGSDPVQYDFCAQRFHTESHYRVWNWYAPTDSELMRLRLKYTEHQDYFYLDLREDIYGA